MAKIAPSILAADFANLERDIRNIEENGADFVHVDIMDGIFVPNISIGIPVVKAIRPVTKLPLDVHLMIDRPVRYVEEFIKAGAVGVGVGGPFDMAAFLAKKALIRPVDERNKDPFWADLELEMLQKINELGIGPQGFGGKTTALCVNIEPYPCHIASLPVAVNINCHVTRHAKEVI